MIEPISFPTYEAFIAHSQRMQRRYIAEETKRNAKLSKLWYDYKAKASKLGFHPLDRREIQARSDELRMMLARVEETHGDTPGQRALWKARQAEAVIPHENIWRPASGYRTENGKSKWRCWNESRPGGSKQFETANGRPWLCDTREAAARKCDELNAVQSWIPPRTADTMSEAIALSSPSGRMSKRARTAAQKRLSMALFGPGGLQPPAGLPPQPTKHECLLREAAQLRELASRGMRPRAFIRQAIECERLAAPSLYRITSDNSE